MVRVQVGDELEPALRGHDLALEVFENDAAEVWLSAHARESTAFELSSSAPVQADADFLVEDFEDLLVGAPSKHVAMLRERPDDLGAGSRRHQVKVVVPVGRKVPQALPNGDQVLDRGHEHVDRRVEPLRDRVVQSRFELLLLADNRVEKVAPIDVRGLRGDGRSVSWRTTK